MLVYTERTPNPRALKFNTGSVLTDRPDHYGPECAGLHPFFGELFSLEGVEGVFVGREFVTVTLGGKSWDADGGGLKKAVIDAIAGHAGSLARIGTRQDVAAGLPEGETAALIAEAIETRIRPAVAFDGGDIVFRAYEDGVLTVDLKGACAGCPSSSATLRHGIAGMMRHLFPEVREVRAA